MQAQDRDTLLQICQRDLPESLTSEYELVRAAWERVKSGPMSADLLIGLALRHGCVTVKASVVSDWTGVAIGSPVQIFKPFNLNEHYADGTFQGVGEGLQTGLILVAVFGDMDNVNPYPERRIRLKGEMPKADSLPKKPIPVDATQPVVLEPVDVELAKLEAPEDLGEAVEAKAGDWAGVAVGTPVDVDTGSGIFAGEFVGVGAEENLGAVAVRIPSLHKGKGKSRKFGWYEEDSVVVRRLTLPIEEQVQQAEASVETPAVVGA